MKFSAMVIAFIVTLKGRSIDIKKLFGGIDFIRNYLLTIVIILNKLAFP